MRTRLSPVLVALLIALTMGSPDVTFAQRAATRVGGALTAGMLAQVSSADVERHMTETSALIEQRTGEKERIDAELSELRGQRQAAQLRVRHRVRSLYRLRHAGLMPFGGGFEALLRHQSRVERLERMASRDAAGLSSLRRRLAALQGQTSELASQLAEGEQNLTLLRTRQQALETERQRVAAYEQAITTPSYRSGQAYNASSYRAPRSGMGIRMSESNGGPRFDVWIGRLPLPVGGSASLVDAEREGGQGVEFNGQAGASVQAVGEGRVAYAAPHPAYGRLVIVEHQGGYYSVYGGLGTVAVRVGQTLRASAPIGAVGTSAVFFQVRRGTRPLSARRWLGI